MTITILSFCIYCKNPLKEDNLQQYHDLCHDSITEFRQSSEYDTALTLTLDPNHAIREERNRERRERNRERRRLAAITARRNREYNRANQIVQVYDNFSYQFLDDPKCVIFKSYSTIIGVLWERNYYVIENNFSLTTEKHIYSSIRIAGKPKSEYSYEYIEYPIREFERLLSNIGINHLQEYNFGTRPTYYYSIWSRERPELNICDRTSSDNKYINKFVLFINHSLVFDRNKYEIYVSYNNSETILKVWNRETKKYLLFDDNLIRNTKRKGQVQHRLRFKHIFRAAGFKPLKRALLSLEGFTE